MANLATLKPFKKNDPRRHIKQKGEISAKTKFRNFIEDYFNYKKSQGISKEKAIKELMERFDKFSKKEARILTYLGDRIYGKQVEKVDLTSGGKPLPLLHNVRNNNGNQKTGKTEKED